MAGIKTNQAFKGSEIWWNDFQMTLKMHFKITLIVLILQAVIFLIILKWGTTTIRSFWGHKARTSCP
jgi:hypothetical protein